MKPSKLSPPAPANDEMRWRARDAMHDIARAEQHKRDPQLMRHVQALAADIHKAVGAEPMREKKRGEAPKNPLAAAKGKSAKRGLGMVMKGDSKRASKLAPMGAAKKRER